MGCGTTNVKHQMERNAEPYKKTEKGFHIMTSGEINYIRNRKLNSEELAFIELAKHLKTDTKVKLKNLDLTHRVYFDLLNEFKKNTNVQQFAMTNIDFLDATDVLLHLYHCVYDKRNLKAFKLKFLSKLGQKKGKAIAKITEALQLEKLVLKEIELEEEDADFLGILLKNYSAHLEYFEISGIFFLERIENFLEGILENNSIKYLVLNKINLQPRNFGYLLSALNSNICLIRLDVSNNPIKEGVGYLKEYPLRNIVTLQMNNCGINDDDFYILCEGLKSSALLKNLSLNNNMLTEGSVPGFHLLLENNTTIVTVYILNNEICKSELKELLKNDYYVKVVAEEMKSL